MSIQLNSLFFLKEFYDEHLAKYTMLSVKRRTLTRDIASHKSFITNIEQALAREGSSKGWFLGDKYSSYHLNHYKKELAFMEKLRAEIV